MTIKAKSGGGYEGAMASPDRAPGEVPLDTAKVENGTLTFAVAAIMGTCSGKRDTRTPLYRRIKVPVKSTTHMAP